MKDREGVWSWVFCTVNSPEISTTPPLTYTTNAGKQQTKYFKSAQKGLWKLEKVVSCLQNIKKND